MILGIEFNKGDWITGVFADEVMASTNQANVLSLAL
jgi:hypothetical protein